MAFPESQCQAAEEAVESAPLNQTCGINTDYDFGVSGNHYPPRSVTIWENLEQRRGDISRIQTRKPKYALLCGQLVSVVAVSMNAASFTLEYGLNKVFPFFLMFHSYLMLSFHLWWSHKATSENEAPYRFCSIKIRMPWWYYFTISILDVGPNYLALLAMNMTSLTSATLLGSLTIPSTMFFCGILLAKVYRPMHYAGVVLCMIGGTITILMDKNSNPEDDHPHSFSGDILCVLAALGYGIGDAAAEFCSKYVDRVEYVGMIGLFGLLWCLIIFPIFEWDAVMDLFQDRDTFLPALGVMLWYVVSLNGYYIVESMFLTKSDATLLNLSLQTSNFWAILFSVIFFHENPQPQFYMAVTLVAGGVVCYELYGNTPNTSIQTRAQETDSEGQLRDCGINSSLRQHAQRDYATIGL